ncbi:FUN14 domain-containing protein [Nitratifractor sp.]
MNDSLKEILNEIPYLEMGSGFLIGMAVGYVLKKTFKVLLIFGGLAVIFLFVLENQHIVTINEDSLSHAADSGVHGFERFALFLKERLARLKLSGGASAVAGFFVGLKMG